MLHSLLWASTKALPYRNALRSGRLVVAQSPTTHLYRLYCVSATPSSGVGFGTPTAPAKQWNVKGLKQEVTRRHQRIFKKVGKAHEKLSDAEEKYKAVMAMSDPPLEVLERCPDPAAVRMELEDLQAQLEALTALESGLKGVKSQRDAVFAELVPAIEQLEVTDEPPPKQVRGPTKVKGKPSTEPRKPYFTYTSAEGVEIRVGRRAEDNDELSCNPEFRDSTNWWMHSAGFPGSHVVIRTDKDDFPSQTGVGEQDSRGADWLELYTVTHTNPTHSFPQSFLPLARPPNHAPPHTQRDVIDAALLAAINSKAKQAGKVQVTLTRCRNVSKPRGAKAGLVQLSGDVLTISVDLKAEAHRLERLVKAEE
eukprot:CAMPEP_0173170450 /NCGR_PEP_ID=MMETSP1141-20130122/1241_1 /TAXON_ID=483371 /ORGANISM="non described non described, Strain CCMP2298" /LENGTH=365 /DNA_ID=CAMNT_0014092339 /DNA_START=139 /DNA_END=1238 /DNA_ORIENTATION=-